MNKYRMASIEELFKGYAFESGRANKEDAIITQSHIVTELYRRLKVSLDMLDDEPENVSQIYKQFIEY